MGFIQPPKDTLIYTGVTSEDKRCYLAQYSREKKRPSAGSYCVGPDGNGVWSEPWAVVPEGPMAISPDGRWAIVYGDEESGIFTRAGKQRHGYFIFDVATGKEKCWFKYSFHSGFAFSPDGKMLAMGDYMTQVYDPSECRYLGSVNAGGYGKALVFSRDSKRLFVSNGKELIVIDVESRPIAELKRVPAKLAERYEGVDISADGRYIATGPTSYMGDKKVSLLDLEAGGPAQDLPAAQVDWNWPAITGLRFSPNGWLLAGLAPKQGIRFWDAETLAEVGFVSQPNCAGNSLSFSADGRRLFVYCASAVGVVNITGADPGSDRRPPTPAPGAPPKVSLKVAFKDASGDGILDADESAEVEVIATNEGKGYAYGLDGRIFQEAPIPGLDVPQRLEFGRLAAGQSASKTVTLRASGSLASGTARVSFGAREANGFDADPVILEFRTRAFQQPKLELAGLAVGGSGVVNAGESTKLTLRIVNTGEGPAAGVRAVVTLGSPDIFAAGDLSAELGSLIPGEAKTASAEFFVNKRFKGKDLPVSVKVTESRGSYGFERNLGLQLGEAAPALVVSVAGRESAKPAPGSPEAAAADDVDAPPASKTAADPDAVAVLVGVERYRDVPGVDFAARDAQTMHAYLTKSMGYDAKNVLLLQNERATKTDLEKGLGAWLRNRVTEKSRVFVFYAGHGAPNPKTGEGYLIPYDGDPSYTAETAFPIAKLYKDLAALPAKQVVVALDACFSGAGGRSVLAKGARPLVSTVKGFEQPGANAVVLSAAAGDQISLTDEEGQHGLLTLAMLRGLRGGADADKDGTVTVGELYRFVRPEVERAARLKNQDQTPMLFPASEREKGGAALIRLR